MFERDNGPVRNLRDVSTFPSIDRAMAHQRYLEQLSFETSRCTS